MELFKGRPEDLSGREEREIRVYDLLDQLGIEYIRTDHEHANTMEACNEIDKVLDVLICKNLFLGLESKKPDVWMLFCSFLADFPIDTITIDMEFIFLR